MTRSVYIDFRTEGLTLACRGVVRDARTREKIAEADDVRPRGFQRAALQDARELVRERGWVEVKPNRDDERWMNVT